MWQLFALGSLFAESFESVVDKFALVSNRKVDFIIATFWRVFLFTLFTALIGLTGLMGTFYVAITPMVILVALGCAINSLFYTYLMRHVEVTTIGVVAYIGPFVFLFIDTAYLHTPLSAGQIVGIVLLVLGGIGFALEGKTFRLKKELSLRVLLMFIFSVFFIGLFSYTFKYEHAVRGMDSVSFFVSYGLLASAVLLVLMISQGASHKLLLRPSLAYLPRVAVSKIGDTASSLLWAQALLYASVSQVSAFGALQPFVLFVLTVVAQKFFRTRLDERLGGLRLEWKAAAVCFLVVGGMLVG